MWQPNGEVGTSLRGLLAAVIRFKMNFRLWVVGLESGEVSMADESIISSSI